MQHNSLRRQPREYLGLTLDGGVVDHRSAASVFGHEVGAVLVQQLQSGESPVRGGIVRRSLFERVARIAIFERFELQQVLERLDVAMLCRDL